MGQDGFRRLPDRGHRRPHQLIGIDDDVGAPALPFLLGHAVEGGRYQHDGRFRILRPEFFDKFKDLRRILFPAVDHDSIRPGFREGESPGQGVLHTPLQNQALDPGTDHEFSGALSFLPGADLLAEIFDAVLRLLHFRAEEGVLLQPRLVLNDHHGHAHPLQGADRVDKMFRQSAGIPVKDDGLGGHLHDIVDGPEAAGHVHQLDIRLALGGGVAEGREPHGVELPGASVLMHNSVLHDQAGQPVVGFHHRDQALHAQQALQPAPAQIRHGQIRPLPVLNLLVFRSEGKTD